jgi:hypothetical protein
VYIDQKVRSKAPSVASSDSIPQVAISPILLAILFVIGYSKRGRLL